MRKRLSCIGPAVFAALAMAAGAQAQPSNIRFWRITEMYPEPGTDAALLPAAVGRPDPGFDCDKAQSTGERLICTDNEIAGADRIISERYAALRRRETVESFATIRAAQRAWLGYTPASCGAAGDMPEDQYDRRNMLECLREAYKGWAEMFADLSTERAGALKIEPRLHVFAELEPRRKIDWIAYPWLIGTPRAIPAAFNRRIAKTLAPRATLLIGRQITEPDAEYPISAWRRYSLANFDDRLVSLFVWGQIYGGGAHEGLIEQALNFDMRQARPVGPADFFRAGSGWEDAITALCLAKLEEEDADEKPTHTQVRSVVVNPQAWLFSPKQATVHFAVYTVGSFAAGPRQVEISYDLLRRYLRPDAPLPAGVLQLNR